MSDPRNRKYRQRKAAEQHQRCFYCGFPMWAKKPNGFAQHFGISLKEAGRFRCTLEHLTARRDGGTSRFDNVAAACWFCNSRRHLRAIALAPDDFRILVQERVAQLAWHNHWLHKMIGRRREKPTS